MSEFLDDVKELNKHLYGNSYPFGALSGSETSGLFATDADILRLKEKWEKLGKTGLLEGIKPGPRKMAILMESPPMDLNGNYIETPSKET